MNEINKVFEKFEKEFVEENYSDIMINGFDNAFFSMTGKEWNQLKSEIQEIVKESDKKLILDLHKALTNEFKLTEKLKKKDKEIEGLNENQHEMYADMQPKIETLEIENQQLKKQNQELKEKIRKRIKYWDKDTPENMMFEPENMDIKSKDLVKFYSKLIIKELSSLIEGGK